MEPERASFLHKARVISDLNHAMHQVTSHENIIMTPTATTSASSLMKKYTPAYLKERVEKEEVLPWLEIRTGGEEEEEDDNMAAATPGLGSPFLHYHHHHHQGYDSSSSISSSSSAEETTTTSNSSSHSLSSSPSSFSYSSTSPTGSSSMMMMMRRNSRSGSIVLEDDPFVLETRRAVFEHVATGGLVKELMVELTEMMLPDWAPSRKMTTSSLEEGGGGVVNSG